MDIGLEDKEPVSREMILAWLQRLPESIRTMVLEIMDQPDFPLRLVKMANQLRYFARDEQRILQDMALLGRRLAPNDYEVSVQSEWVLLKRVPLWHFSLVHDAARNTVFENALNAFVKPSSIVLEIGTGSGILAMMAVRAGARHVYTCESESVLAEAARENIRKNGCQDRITVIPRLSTDLRIGADLPEKADILVAEIFNSHLLGENVLVFAEDARKRLLKTDAILLPGNIAARGVLIGDGPWIHHCMVGQVSGFDLSALNRFKLLQTMASRCDYDLTDAFCDPVDLFAFDLVHGAAFPEEKRNVRATTTRDGLVYGFLQWIRLEFAEGIVYENKPPQESSWTPVVNLFQTPQEVRSGQPFTLTAAHDRRRIYVWPNA